MLFRVFLPAPVRALGPVAVLIALVGGAGCGNCNGGGFDAGPPDIPVVGGQFSLAWSLVDDSGQVVCNDIASCCDRLDPNATVFVQADRLGTSGVDQFSCRNGAATSSMKFAPGQYNFTYALRIPIAGQSTTIANAMPEDSVRIASGMTAPLTPILFHINLTGHLAFTLQAGLPGTKNCLGGEEISGFAISVEHAGGPGDTGCAPVVLTLSGGGTYNASSCTSPSTGRCIESGETLSVTSFLSGPYQIHIRGKKRATLDCWTNDDSFFVPPQGMPLVRTFNLAFASETPGCQ